MSVHLTIKKNSWRRLAINRILWIILFLNDENSLNINYLHTTSLSLVFLLFIFFLILNFYFYFILLYNTVLVLAYIDMNPPRVYMSSQTWTPLPPPTPHHPSRSSPCTSPKHPASCIEHRLAIRFLHDSIHVSMPFSQIIPPSPSPKESYTQFPRSLCKLFQS